MKLTKKILRQIIKEELISENDGLTSAKPGDQFWLKGKGTIEYALFDVKSSSVINVLALIGATRYINKDMSVSDARKTYLDLKSKGWTAVSEKDVKRAGMSRSTLKANIYD